MASYFRLAANRSPAYEQVQTLVEANFVIVDADHAEAVRAVRAAGRVQDGVFIGAQAPDGASAWMMRELDSMVAAAQSHQRSPLSVPTDPNAGAVVRRPQRSPPAATRGGPVPARRSSDAQDSGFMAVPEMPKPARPTSRGANALLVDDSEIALRFLESRLQRLGLATERAGNGAKAIECLSRTAYDFVFLDVDLGPDSEMDGLSLCQHIKRQHHHVGGNREPVVVMVSAFHSELDRARGALAGADAYLGKPMDETALSRLLSKYDPVASTRP